MIFSIRTHAASMFVNEQKLPNLFYILNSKLYNIVFFFCFFAMTLLSVNLPLRLVIVHELVPVYSNCLYM